jgi:hypothetical protein
MLALMIHCLRIIWAAPSPMTHSTMTMTKIYLALSAQDDSDNHRHASPVANWRL